MPSSQHGVVVSLALLWATGASVYGAASPSTTDERRLRSDLFHRGYDRDTLPGRPTNVSVRFHILHINLNEEAQELLLDAWVSMEWIDPRLSWNKDGYGGLSNIRVPPEKFWRPDISVYNSGDMSAFQVLSSDTHGVLTSDGSMLWIATSKVSSSCLLDLTLWPADTHSCTIKFGSWVHDIGGIDLYPKDERAEIEMPEKVMEFNGPWRIRNDSVHRLVTDYGASKYVAIYLTMEIERVAPVYNWTVKMPALGLCALTAVIFILPSASIEKIIVGGIILLLNLLFMMFTSVLVKHSSSHTPLIVQLVSEQFILSLACVLVSSVIVRLARGPCRVSPPVCIRKPVTLLAGLCCIVSQAPPPTHKGPEEVELTADGLRCVRPGQTKASPQQVWFYLAVLLDRFFLFLYFILIIVKLISYSSVL